MDEDIETAERIKLMWACFKTAATAAASNTQLKITLVPDYEQMESKLRRVGGDGIAPSDLNISVMRQL